MDCIYCGSKTGVSNSRQQKKANQIWRRRRCTSCKAVFSTLEGVDLGRSVAIDKDGRLEPFSREKLLLSVFSACGHRKDAMECSTALTGTIVGKILAGHNSPLLKSDDIVSVTSAVLKRFDRAAYVQYNAYHPLHGTK